jgi:hypothetical protein
MASFSASVNRLSGGETRSGVPEPAPERTSGCPVTPPWLGRLASCRCRRSSAVCAQNVFVEGVSARSAGVSHENPSFTRHAGLSLFFREKLARGLRRGSEPLTPPVRFDRKAGGNHHAKAMLEQCDVEVMVFALQRKLESVEQRPGCEQMVVALREKIAVLQAGRVPVRRHQAA